MGDGADDLVCRCAGSILVRGHHPGTLLAIGIECAACGKVTDTPGLPTGQVLPIGVRVAERTRMAVAEPLALAPGMVLADRDELARVELLTTPRNVPAAPFEMSAATLATAAADYDRLSGGEFFAHRRAVAAASLDAASALGHLPLAWALPQLEAGVDTPGWWCLAKEPDAVAAVQLGAFREFPLVWSQHPLFPAMAASAAAGGFSTHALAVFAAARCMGAAGTRVGFAAPDRDDGRIEGFLVETAPTQRLPVLVRRFDRFDWPRGRGLEVAAVRAAAIDALIASQSRINVRQPGILVLSVGSVLRQHDPIIIEGVSRTLLERGRRHRGLAAVALVLPKIYPAGRSDQVVFGWTFLPFANPQHGGSLLRLGALPGAATQGTRTG